MNVREKIAWCAAQELTDGMVVNLGIGLPTMIAGFAPEGVKTTLQSENGILGMAAFADANSIDRNIVNAGGAYVTVNAGDCFFDSALSFSIIRGGHVNLTVLGTLQVDETGSLASHIIPGKIVPGMGGAMDLVTGSRKVIVAMTHTAKGGAPKILKRITLPATAVNKVNMIITELAVIEVIPDGLLLKDVAKGVTVKEVQNATEAELIVRGKVGNF